MPSATPATPGPSDLRGSTRVALVNDTGGVGHHGCRRVMSLLRAALQQSHLELVGALPTGTMLPLSRDGAALVDAVDLVVVNGEGSIHHQRPHAMALVGVIEHALAQGKKVALVNALWQDNGAELAATARRCDVVFARDRRSQRELLGHGVAAEYAPDLTFLGPCRSDARRIAGTLALTDSVFREFTDDAYRYAQRHGRTTLAPIVTSRSDRANGGLWSRRRAKEALYLTLLRLTAGRFPRSLHYRVLRWQRATHQDYVDFLAGHEAVVCYRFHALCFCLQAGIPFLAVPSNSWKIEALIEEAGLPLEQRVMRHGDVMRAPPAELISRAQLAEDDRAILAAFLVRAEAWATQMLRDVASLAKCSR